MIERIVARKTQQRIQTSDVALQFAFSLLTVEWGIGEKTQGGSSHVETNQSFMIRKYASTFWMLLHVATKKKLLSHMLGIGATVDTLRVNNRTLS